MTAEQDVDPVYVIEAIPVGGDNELDPAEITVERIPTPAHLRIYNELGRGGMGHVHPATDRNLLRHVALKRLDKNYAGTAFYREGFIAEAQITGQLEHPNIVPVHELAVDDRGIPYFTMKLVQGISFAHWLRKSRHAVGTTERIEDGLDIVLKVCDAVAYAHHRGVIHRDLKPENIMVGDFGQVYLMDWGLARLTRTRPASGSHAQMETPGPVGTPGYMAPEQARGNPAEMDERSDVFGLGALLYELVSGKLPFGNPPTTEALMKKSERGEVVSIEEAAAGSGVARRLLTIVAKATAPERDARYPNVLSLRREVHAFLRGGLHLPRKVFRAGELILREGDRGDAAYMIVTGKCRAFLGQGATQQTLAVMGAGDVFGEMALVLEEPRAASVEAMEAVTVLLLDKQTMNEGLGVDGWTGALVRALAQRFRDLELQVRNAGMRRGHDPAR